MTEVDEVVAAKNRLQLIKLWFVVPLSIATVFGGLWTIGQRFYPIRDLDLTVWITRSR
jgi:hypothetical protein